MIVVIGGGLMGVTTARALAARGHRVTLVERAAELATAASRANGGQLSWSHLDPLAGPAMLRMLPSILLGLDPAIALRALPGPHLVRWGLAFLANCTEARARASLRALFALAELSRKALTEINSRHELSYHHRCGGKLVLFATPSELTTARRNQDFKDSIGCKGEILSADECLALEPALAAIHHRIAGGLHLAGDENGDSHLFCTQLADRIVEQGGVELALGREVGRILVRDGTAVGVATDREELDADQVVLAAGMASAQLARAVGIRLPLLPVKGYSLNLPAIAPAAPRLSVTDLKHKTVYSEIGGQLRIAGLHQIGAGDTGRSERKVRQLLRRAEESFPEAADYAAEPIGGPGLRPTTPDSRPMIGATPVRNLWLNTGHGMLGWTLACGSAELLAQLMAEETPTLNPADFALNRFRP